jgi:hypothetical protein
VCLAIVEMMEHAVDKNHVARLHGSRRNLRDVGDAKIASVPSARIGDVAVVEVETGVVHAGKMMSGGARAAADVDHATDAREIVVREERPQLRLCERRLPDAVRECIVHQVSDSHG